MKPREIISHIVSCPVLCYKAVFGKNNSSDLEKEKPAKVIVVPTPGAKAAMYRDWVMALCFATFAGLTISDRVFKVDKSDNLDKIIKNLDLNNDGHISKEEIEIVKNLITVIEKEGSKK